MNRQQKEAMVSNLKEMLTTSQAAFLVGYKGLDVALMQSLRGDLRELGGTLKITKARLMKLAAQDIDGAQKLQDDFKDQVGLVFAKDEVPSVAKKLVEFSKDNGILKIITGFFEARVLSKQEIDYLASLPSRDVLLAQLAGTIQAPISSFARLLNTMVVRLLYTLKQVSEQEK